MSVDEAKLKGKLHHPKRLYALPLLWPEFMKKEIAIQKLKILREWI